jgi:heme exporter protein C
MTVLTRSAPATLIAALILFATAPWLIYRAPYESTMGLAQKIFYFHVPAGLTMFLAIFVCGIASLSYLRRGRAGSDRVAEAAAELAVLIGAMVLVTGPLWARKSWGVWWEWDARITQSLVLWLIFIGYLVLRRFGGPGSERLAAGVGIFGMVNVPFVYWSVNVWRTLHPQTTVVMTLQPGMRGPFWFCAVAFLLLTVLLFAARVRLEQRRSELEALYLAVEDA